MTNWKCRYAPSLGALEGTPMEIWGTEPYNPETDINKPCVWFGLYGLSDFFSLWRHKGRKAILWCGSDINHFLSGYWLDEDGRIRIEPEQIAQWINENCESYVENGVEHQALMVLGINSKIVPSFMGKIEDYKLELKWNERPQVYMSVSGDNFAMYGWNFIENIADKCNVDFHLYGNNDAWHSRHMNVFVHGRVPKEQMNEEIKHMHCGLRTLDFDGMSEILVKSVLWGQYPISYIGYPLIDNYKTTEELVQLLNGLALRTFPNTKAREYYLKVLNQYPWTK